MLKYKCSRVNDNVWDNYKGTTAKGILNRRTVTKQEVNIDGFLFLLSSISNFISFGFWLAMFFCNFKFI